MKVHFVGSVPLPDSHSTFFTLSKSLPQTALTRLPDGETGKRKNFVQWNRDVFPAWSLVNPFEVSTVHSFAEQELQDAIRTFPEVKTKYDEEAIKSYAVFRELKQQGIVAEGTKFQVGVPPAMNFVQANIQPALQVAVTQIMDDALVKNIRTMMERIEHKDLAVQIDMAVEFVILEGQWYEEVKTGVHCIDMNASKEEKMEQLAENVIKLAEAVDEDVDLGLHFCYGNAMNKHFVEPKDTAMIAEFASVILGKLKRRVQWIHFPVPKDRVDEAYLCPLKDILLPKLPEECELSVGLVHGNDIEGTMRRIEVATGVLGRQFSIATECGLGRTDKEGLYAVLIAMKAVLETKGHL